MKPSPDEPKNEGAWMIPSRKVRQIRSRPAAPSSREANLDLALGTLQPGDQISRRFQIKERVGTGGMSIVYRAADNAQGVDVALKFISPALLQEPTVIDLFKKEAKIASSLAHPGIIKVFELHQEQGLYFLHMEFFRGVNLRQWLAEKRKDQGSPSLTEVNDLVQSICKALIYAHKTTVHRDLKPENIGVLPGHETKLMDFGLAQLLHQPHTSVFRESVSQISAGTPYYMAPEILSPNTRIDGRADQYSVAVMTYELLTGKLPLGLVSSLTESRPDLPLRFTRAVDRALNSRVELRFPSIEAFAEELNAGAQPEAVTATVYRKAYHAPNWSKKLALLAALGLLLIPVIQLAHREIQQRGEALRQAYQSQVAAEEKANQTKQAIEALRQESAVLRRSMDIEAAATAKLSETFDKSPSPEWVSLSNQWHVVQSACRWLEPRVNAQGHWFQLQETLDASRKALERHELDTSQALLESFAQDHREIDGLMAKLRQLFERNDQLQRSADFINTVPEISPSNLSQSLNLNNWTNLFQSLTEQSSSLEAEIEQRRKAALQNYQTAQENWNQLFPENMGAPDLSFLYDTQSAYESALELFEAEDWRSAFALMEESTAYLTRWAHEVEAARSRCAQTWNQTPHRIEALGMRFVRVNGIYWSVWEFRVMDFGRWLAFNPEIAHLVLQDLDLNPEHIGPTHPMTGLDRQTVLAIAAWAGYQMTEFTRLRSMLPSSTQWKNLWASESLEGNYRFGIIPQTNPERMIILKDYYLDPQLRSENFLQPVGSEPATLHGLYDLTGNAWEWSDSELVLDRDESTNQQPFKWMIHGGGTYGEMRFHTFEPPRPNAVFVNRLESIGFRVVLTPNRFIDQASGFSR